MRTPKPNDKRRSSDEPSPEELSSGEPAYCLVSGQSWELVAVDTQIAAWLDCEPTECSTKRLSQLLPDFELASLLSPSPSSCRTTSRVAVNCGEPWMAEIVVRLLAGPESHLRLIAIHPLDRSDVTHRDALTGLADRRELVRHRERWRQVAGSHPLPHALLFLDLDNFKQVNDTHGHALGDRVLATLATRWRECIRDGDLLVRYGGDEFVVLLSGIRTRAEVEPIELRLKEATRHPMTIDDVTLCIHVTIGVALADNVTDDLESLLAVADRDLYAVKRQKK